MKWTNVRALVTGAASGLGLAVAKRIIAAGGYVAIVDLPQVLENQPLSADEKRCIAIAADVCDEQSVVDAVQSTVTEFGEINVLVNCAGIIASEKMLSMDHIMQNSDFERVIAVNLIGTFRVCRLVAASMQHNSNCVNNEERAVIINTASIAAYEGQIGQLAYSASKGGIVSMTLPMARELARFNIRVMSIAPGTFATSMLADLADTVKQKLMAQTVYPHRLGKAEEFAQTVQHIVENPMLNGSVIRLDGGLRLPVK